MGEIGKKEKKKKEKRKLTFTDLRGSEGTEKGTGLHRWIRGLGMYLGIVLCVLYF